MIQHQMSPVTLAHLTNGEKPMLGGFRAAVRDKEEFIEVLRACDRDLIVSVFHQDRKQSATAEKWLGLLTIKDYTRRFKFGEVR